MCTISLNEFRALQSENKKINLVDIREHSAHENFNVGGISIPLDELVSRLDELDADLETVVYCDIGEVSKEAVKQLKRNGFIKSRSLGDGVLRLQIAREAA